MVSNSFLDSSSPRADFWSEPTSRTEMLRDRLDERRRERRDTQTSSRSGNRANRFETLRSQENLARKSVLVGMVAVAGGILAVMPAPGDESADGYALSALGSAPAAESVTEPTVEVASNYAVASAGNEPAETPSDDVVGLDSIGRLSASAIDINMLRSSRSTTTAVSPTTAPPTTLAPKKAVAPVVTAADTTEPAEVTTTAAESDEAADSVTEEGDASSETDTSAESAGDETAADGETGETADAAATEVAAEETTTTTTAPAGNGYVDAGNGVAVPPVLLEIRRCESSGNYQAANTRSSARGAYQFLTGSWKHYGHAARYGVSQAHLASRAQQDEAALITWERDGTRPWNASKACWG